VQTQQRQPLRRQVEVKGAALSAMQSALQRQLVLANRSRTMLFPFIGRSKVFQTWQHYPHSDAVDRTGAWQFYFHAHDTRANEGEKGGARHPQEHGHIHLFQRDTQGQLSHVTGLSLDARGVPLAWFTCNQWVTGERWKRATVLARGLPNLKLELRGPLAGVALWLGDLVRGYAEPLRAMLLARDAALLAHCRQQRVSTRQALKDRSVALWSSHPIHWPHDAIALRAQSISYHNPRRSS
jgi:hypothetical protein